MPITNSAVVAAGDANVTPLMSSFTLTFGWTATAGRVLVAVFAGDKSTGTFTTPTGWTLGPSIINTDVTLILFYKVSDGTETQIAFSWTTLIRMAGAYCMERDDVTLTGILSNSANSGATTVTSQDTGSVTAPAVPTIAIAAWAMDSINSYPGGAPLTSQPTWSNSFARVAGQNDTSATIPGGNGGFPAWSVATLGVSANGGSITTTADWTGGTADQAAAAILLLAATGGALTTMSGIWGT